VPKIIELRRGIQMLQAKTSVGTTLFEPPCISHPPGGKLLLLFARPAVTFLASTLYPLRHRASFGRARNRNFGRILKFNKRRREV